MNKKKLAILGIVAVLVFLFFHFHLGSYLTLDALKENRERLTAFYAGHRLAMVAGFIGIYVLQTALSLPGATILSLAAGAIFGVIQGTILAVTGATAGAVAAFLAVRYLLHDTVQARFGERLEGINRELETRGLSYLLFLRLVPLFPFFLINLAAGVTRLPLRTFALGTFIGIIPGGFVYVNAGASLATIDSVSQIASPRVLASFALLGVFALIPAVYQKAVRKKRDR